ncbi:MAG: hypothetical protein JNM68_14655 [Dinghuibacter sp.]|nr:hypothetical protein [Dinghuibacter sp.]
MNNNTHSICLVSCYVGRLPWYFQLFLKTCAANPDVSFLFITDNQCRMPIPENVQWVVMQLEEIEQLARRKTGFNIPLQYAYKLCDIKPAYGVIFEHLLHEYDFWGHCDIDIVFGNIRTFMTNELLREYDVICVVPQYVTGFFTLFRNTEQLNRLYTQSKDCRLVFESKKHYCFDECNHLFNYLKKGRSIFELPSEVESMTHVIKKAAAEGQIRAYFNQFVIEARPGNMMWDHGALIISGKYEILLYHLIEFKQLKYYFFPFRKKIPERFYIERFYFCAYAPDSFPGRIYSGFYRLLTEAAKWLKTIRHNIFSSPGIKRSQFSNPEQYSGTYTYLVPSRHRTHISIVRNRLFVQFNKEQPLPLRHVKKNLFYCRKWNIEIEFGFSKTAEKIHLVGKSIFSENASEEFLV